MGSMSWRRHSKGQCQYPWAPWVGKKYVRQCDQQAGESSDSAKIEEEGYDVFFEAVAGRRCTQ